MLITKCNFSPSIYIDENTLCCANITINGFIHINSIELYRDKNPMTKRTDVVVEFPSSVYIPDQFIRNNIKAEIIDRYNLWKKAPTLSASKGV